jgi:hypothetical protein
MAGQPETALERRLWGHAAAGTELDLGPPPVHTTDRRIATSALRELLLDDVTPIHARGVRVRGAWFAETLDLAYAKIPFPVILQDCWFGASPDELADLNVRNARLGVFSVTGSHLRTLYATEAHIDGDLNCRGCTLAGDLDGVLTGITGHALFGMRVAGSTRLISAQIGGDLDCRGGDFHGPVIASSMRVGGGVGLATDKGGRRCHVRKGLRLEQVDIGRDLNCRGGRFLDLDAGGAKVGHNVDLGCDEQGRPCSSEGTVNFSFAEIGGALSGSGMELGGELRAEGMHVSGSVAIRPQCAVGAITLGGSEIEGDLDLRDGKFASEVVANRVTVGNNVRLGRADAHGAVILTLAEIAGDLDCAGGRFRTGVTANRIDVGGNVGFRAAQIRGPLVLSGSTVAGDLVLHGTTLDGNTSGLVGDGLKASLSLVWLPEPANRGSLSLRHAYVGTLVDSQVSWPDVGRLDIEHLIYDGFGQGAPTKPPERIDWLRRQHPFRAQPYEHLMRFYRAHAQDADARAVGIACEQDRRRHGDLGPLGWLWSMLLAGTIRYGYVPGLALAWLLGLYVAGLGIFACAGDRGAFLAVRARTTASATTQPAPPSSARCLASDAYPCFNALAYGVDVVIPLLNLRQAEYWQPDPTKPAGNVARYYGWIATPLGWLFATLTVAAFTGLIRKD